MGAEDGNGGLSNANIRWLESEFKAVRDAVISHTHPGYKEDIDGLKATVYKIIGGLGVLVFVIEIGSKVYKW